MNIFKPPMHLQPPRRSQRQSLLLQVNVWTVIAVIIFSVLAHVRAGETSDSLPRTWTYLPSQRSSWSGFSIGAAGDLDRDGFLDLVIGTPRFVANGNRTGGFVSFSGNRDGLKDTPTSIILGNGRDVRFGDELVGIVDVNGDGFGDVLVARPDPTSACVFVYHGTASGPKTNHMPRLCVQVPGSPRTVRIADAGDLNGDGIQDILIGVSFPKSAADFAPIFWPVQGSATGLVWQTELPMVNAGNVFAGAGDVNGDGFADVLAGLASFEDDEQVLGKATLHFGSREGLRTAPDWSVLGSDLYQRLGAAVAGVGDVNGDGFDDIAICAPGRNPKREGVGHLLVFYGSRLGPSTAPDWMIAAERPGVLFGRAITGVGDVDGNGCDDFVVSATFWRESYGQEGRVYLYLGTTNGPETSPRLTIDGGLGAAQLGFALAKAGDLDGDGLADFAIGSPFYGIAPFQAGRVDLFYGSLEAYQKPLHLVAKGGRFERFIPTTVAMVGESRNTNNQQTPASIGDAARRNASIPWVVATGLVLALGGAGLFAWNKQCAAVLRERERIARDLHDEVGAHLTTLVQLGRSAQGDQQTQELSSAALEITRAFEQAVWAVRPNNSTLEQFITFLGVQAPKFFVGTGTRCLLNLPAVVPKRELTEATRKNLLAVVKEALNNAAKHAQAREVWLQIEVMRGSLKLQIEDDGCGFRVNGKATKPSNQFASTGRGLENMQHRISDLGGRLQIANRAGGGTTVAMEIPL